MSNSKATPVHTAAAARAILNDARKKLETLRESAARAGVALDPGFVAQAEANLAHMERAVAGIEASQAIWEKVADLTDRMTAALAEPAAAEEEKPWVN